MSWSSLKIQSFDQILLTLNTDPKNQWVGDPQVLPVGDKFIITCAGDKSYSDTSVADAAYAIVRNADGTHTIPTAPVLAFKPSAVTNYLGTGMGSCVSPYSLDAVMGITDLVSGASWLTWATSSNGLDWVMLTEDGTLTIDPLESEWFLLAGDATTASGIPRIWHNVMAYNEADNSYYIVVGVGYDNGAIMAEWWKMKRGARPQPIGLIVPDAIDPICLVKADTCWVFMYYRDFTPTIYYRLGDLTTWSDAQVLDLSPVTSTGFVVPCATRNAPHSVGMCMRGMENGKPVFLGYLSMGTAAMCSQHNQTDFLSSMGLVPLTIVGV